eukprot:Rhum_TRINITY_DN11017_c2_g1::Rhum_TRINITY_DN11017_c2_g1_i1::g.42024::m.42024
MAVLTYERVLDVGGWRDGSSGAGGSGGGGGDSAAPQHRVVGVEDKSGLVLVARVEGARCFLDSYSVAAGAHDAARRRRTLLAQGGGDVGGVAWDIASASVTPDRSLVALTVKNFSSPHPRSDRDAAHARYECFLIPAAADSDSSAAASGGGGGGAAASYYKIKTPRDRSGGSGSGAA